MCGKVVGKLSKMQFGGIYRGTRRQKGGKFKDNCRQREGKFKDNPRQRGGLLPLAFLGPLAAAAIPAAKAAAAAAGLGLVGSLGHHVGDSIVKGIRRKQEGGGKRRRSFRSRRGQQLKFVGLVKQRK